MRLGGNSTSCRLRRTAMSIRIWLVIWAHNRLRIWRWIFSVGIRRGIMVSVGFLWTCSWGKTNLKSQSLRSSPSTIRTRVCGWAPWAWCWLIRGGEPVMITWRRNSHRLCRAIMTACLSRIPADTNKESINIQNRTTQSALRNFWQKPSPTNTSSAMTSMNKVSLIACMLGRSCGSIRTADYRCHRRPQTSKRVLFRRRRSLCGPRSRNWKDSNSWERWKNGRPWWIWWTSSIDRFIFMSKY